MATLPFSRRSVTLLTHILGWVLLGYLFFFAQWFGSDVRLPALFWVKQGIFLTLVVAVFYGNTNYLVPRLFVHGQTGRYILTLLGIAVVVVAVMGAVEFWFDLPRQMHLAFHPDGRGRPKLYGWIQPTVFTTLLVLAISTSVAMAKKWQDDALLRTALEQAKTTSELSFLKAQINPHFFFNTLNNIYALTLIDADTAREALHRLSRMMRYVLYETQSGTTLLSKEIAFLTDYVQLMQLRLTDKVSVVVETPANLRDQPVAPMLLLPFVENAFKHGVSSTETSRIYVSVAQQNGQLLMDVRNTVFSQKSLSLEAGNGIGLVNTRRRLDLLYPGQYALHINPRDPSGEYHVHLSLTLS